MDEILINRPNGLPRPQHMSDGLLANPPTVCAVIPGDCNAHGRRKVKDKQEQWPKVWIYIKSVYKIVYKADANAKKLNLNDPERLILHRKESLPVMKAMSVWMLQCLNNKTIDPNSNLGGNFEYFLVREKSLMAFCNYPGFPLDNNLCESAQKLVTQHRKNVEYYRTKRGALAADVIKSLGATAKKAGVNPHDYFIARQRYSAEVEKNPEKFLPWNYLATIKELDKGPPQRVLEVSEEVFYDCQKRLRSTKAWGKPRGSKNESPMTTVAAT